MYPTKKWFWFPLNSPLINNVWYSLLVFPLLPFVCLRPFVMFGIGPCLVYVIPVRLVFFSVSVHFCLTLLPVLGGYRLLVQDYPLIGVMPFLIPFFHPTRYVNIYSPQFDWLGILVFVDLRSTLLIPLWRIPTMQGFRYIQKYMQRPKKSGQLLGQEQ